jgi:chromatin remodeling complex protein RSC6
MARSAAPAATKPSAPVPAAAPAKKAEPAPSAKAAAKEPKAAATPAVATPAVEPAATAVAEPVAATNPCEELGSKLTSVVAALKELQSLVKALSKDYDKMKKTVEKSERKRANARTNPNGFAKPTKIVDELCDFCGVERGTKMSRTDVTRAINSYIKEKNLNKPENKRQILPDEKLRTLLKLKAGEEVNYFRMQAFLSPLFIKETATA